MNFSDFELDSYQLRNFRASSRKKMFPGWVLALPPRPHITSVGAGAPLVVVLLEMVWESDDSDGTLSAVAVVDEEAGESGCIKHLELSLPGSVAGGGGSVGISLLASLLIPPNTLLKLILSIRSFLYSRTHSLLFFRTRGGGGWI